jgi:hypothetical protein
MSAWEALLAESEKVGWPLHWRTDLDHDKRLLDFYSPTQFGWVLRQCGTEMLIPVDEPPLSSHWTNCGAKTPRQFSLKWADALMKSPDHVRDKVYWWDGAKLKPTTYPKMIERLARFNVKEGTWTPTPT